MTPLQHTAPAIRTRNQTGRGPASARHAVPDGIASAWFINTPETPVPPGGGIELFATGAGPWHVPLQSDIEGYVLGLAGNIVFKAKPIIVTIGGKPAAVIFQRVNRQRLWSILQVNAIVPAGIGSGHQPVVLKIGDADNAAQGVTISVR